MITNVSYKFACYLQIIFLLYCHCIFWDFCYIQKVGFYDNLSFHAEPPFLHSINMLNNCVAARTEKIISTVTYIICDLNGKMPSLCRKMFPPSFMTWWSDNSTRKTFVFTILSKCSMSKLVNWHMIFWIIFNVIWFREFCGWLSHLEYEQ